MSADILQEGALSTNKKLCKQTKYQQQSSKSMREGRGGGASAPATPSLLGQADSIGKIRFVYFWASYKVQMGINPFGQAK
jgi:hypothetical protein